MTYYSGTSLKMYVLQKDILQRQLDHRMRINCYNDFELAKDFAQKRAQQDTSVPVVIEITREKDFEVIYGGITVLVGRITEDNHELHVLEAIVEEPIVR
ncbi:hypothetical protein KY349_01785 [Candidatus Woesearchaeota archaeon]|nr:hypothetical protein [Candidatus Woesearchaeota archaeon]